MIIAKYISPFLHNRIVIAQIFHRNKKDKFTLQKKQIHINAGASFYFIKALDIFCVFVIIIIIIYIFCIMSRFPQICWQMSLKRILHNMKLILSNKKFTLATR